MWRAAADRYAPGRQPASRPGLPRGLSSLAYRCTWWMVFWVRMPVGEIAMATEKANSSECWRHLRSGRSRNPRQKCRHFTGIGQRKKSPRGRFGIQSPGTLVPPRLALDGPNTGDAGKPSTASGMQHFGMFLAIFAGIAQRDWDFGINTPTDA